MKVHCRAKNNEFIASLNDTIAENTHWCAAKNGGASYREHELVEISPTRMEFRITVRAMLFFSVLVLIGVPFLILAVYAISAGEKEGGIFLVPALLFGGIGGLVGYFTSRPRVFDLAAGWFWVGRKPISTTKVKRNNNCAPLKMVHALQIVREIVTSEGDQSSTSFNSYELNLVLNDGSRINVIDHGDIDKIRTDSARLSKFLNVPVWDATL